MCGIAGILRDESKGPVLEAELVNMVQALAHRGPDGRGVRVLDAGGGASLGLAHTRLAIVDLSDRAAQPMTSNSGRTTIVFNGEIYNHRRLRARLEAMGARFRTSSDTEVILEGYEVWGQRVVHELEGMFAFALWDHRTGQLHLVRDRAGEKPLFVLEREGSGVLAFASEIKALRAVAALAIEPTPAPLLDYLIHGYVPPPGTFYRDVTQLLPGHHTVVATSAGKLGRAVTERYWRPVFQRRHTVPSFADAKREVRERMRAIVRDRFEADVPVGAFLSGGLDSAAVVGVATKDLGKNVHTYSIGFDDAAWDEAPDARLSAEHLGSTHEEFRVSQRDMPSIPLLVAHHDGPFSDSSAIPTYLVSKLARSKVTVALTGDGGDEVFGGYPRLLVGALASYLPAPLRGLLGRAADSLPNDLPHSLERARRLGRAAGLSLEDRAIAWGSLFRRDEAIALFGTRDWSGSLSKNDSAYDRAVLDESVGQSPLARLLDHNFRTYLPDDLLVKVDRSAMAVSLETRAPFLDSGLIDFVGGLPDSYKQRGTQGKRLAREAFADLFAPALLTRPKRGFGIPLDTWLNGPLRAELDDHLATENARIYQFLDRDAVYSDLYKKGHLDWNGAQRAFTLWTLEVWLREVGL
jgi:asparagine synthase (glutamine-hydrolysing)